MSNLPKDTPKQVFYTGIGSRDVPADIAILMEKIAGKLCRANYHLRSGAANGSDSAFEYGVLNELDGDISKTNAAMSVYLPWLSFGKRNTPRHPYARVLDHPDTYALVEKHHPNAANLSHSVIDLMRRNCHQVLGDDLHTPSSFVICWTPDGAENGISTSSATGGTGMAIRLASSTGIPVFNLANTHSRERISKWVARVEDAGDTQKQQV